MISITARQLRAERQKIRHTKALLVPLGFLGFEILWTMWQLSSMKPSEFSQGYLIAVLQSACHEHASDALNDLCDCQSGL